MIEISDLLIELKKISKLLSLVAMQGKTQGEKIILLDQIGFSPKEIGELIGASSNLVSVTLFKARKKTKSK